MTDLRKLWKVVLVGFYKDPGSAALLARAPAKSLTWRSADCMASSWGCLVPSLTHPPANNSGTNRIKDPACTRPKVPGGARPEMKTTRRKTKFFSG
eukprot:scaffold66256_cov45-Prasinocladus_malaysianus.AAC.1